MIEKEHKIEIIDIAHTLNTLRGHISLNGFYESSSLISADTGEYLEIFAPIKPSFNQEYDWYESRGFDKEEMDSGLISFCINTLPGYSPSSREADYFQMSKKTNKIVSTKRGIGDKAVYNKEDKLPQDILYFYKATNFLSLLPEYILNEFKTYENFALCMKNNGFELFNLEQLQNFNKPYIYFNILYNGGGLRSFVEILEKHKENKPISDSTELLIRKSLTEIHNIDLVKKIVQNIKK